MEMLSKVTATAGLNIMRENHYDNSQTHMLSRIFYMQSNDKISKQNFWCDLNYKLIMCYIKNLELIMIMAIHWFTLQELIFIY